MAGMFNPPARVVTAAAVAWACLVAGAHGSDFADPAPPAVAALASAEAAKPQANADVTFHARPRPLAAGAVTQDWPSFLGPTHNLASAETKLLKSFPADGLKLVWESTRGSGYAAPAVLGDRLVFFHRVGDEEIVDCVTARRASGSGGSATRAGTPTATATTTARASRRSSRATRSTPSAPPPGCTASSCRPGGAVAAGPHGRVQAQAELLRLRRPAARRGRQADRQRRRAGGPSVAAFDCATGKMLWGAGKEWGQSYAAPVPATVHGKRRVFVFAGGESDPPTGGLMCIDPANGRVDFTFPWRGRQRESVNGSAPLVFDGDKVFVSECYGLGRRRRARSHPTSRRASRSGRTASSARTS
jgi:hypothetical protein